MKIEYNYYDEMQEFLDEFDRNEAVRKAAMTQEELRREKESIRQECQAFLANLPKKPPKICALPEEELERRYGQLEYAAMWLGGILQMNVMLERISMVDVSVVMKGAFFAVDDPETRFYFRRLLNFAKGFFLEKDGALIRVSFHCDLCKGA